MLDLRVHGDFRGWGTGSRIQKDIKQAAMKVLVDMGSEGAPEAWELEYGGRAGRQWGPGSLGLSP